MTADRVVHMTGLAAEDVEGMTAYLRAAAGPALALRFVENAERAFGQILDLPGIGVLLGLDELPYEDVRRWHVDGFERLLILYRPVADGVEVIRVLHAARDMPAVLRASGP
ncbi:type II toxin-antitoxin system RelE/ParE family toxin [Zavarzinella formosa]|uniref:type II toxin-antitoxin system RelE/ParE family toxin n=1 Tax=Zavarzinella formosa TaxID=360055 RepID=UPI000317AF21|nr:type II toxin-antitoxin system RelE/ParE family toxin [Zavarzinella formosa]